MSDLTAENAHLRQQMVSLVTAMMGGCTGVTIRSNDEHLLPPGKSSMVHRCLLQKRLERELETLASPKGANP